MVIRDGQKFLDTVPKKENAWLIPVNLGRSLTALKRTECSRRDTVPSSRLGLNKLSASISCLLKHSLWKLSLHAKRKPKKPHREAPTKVGPGWAQGHNHHRHVMSCVWAILKRDSPGSVKPHQLVLHGNATARPCPNCRFKTKTSDVGVWGHNVLEWLVTQK